LIYYLLECDFEEKADMRTTITIDEPLFEKIRELSHREHKPLTRIISELLTRGIRSQRKKEAAGAAMDWHAKAMGARIDYRDKEALYEAMEQ
jgi:hypothetical protein